METNPAVEIMRLAAKLNPKHLKVLRTLYNVGGDAFNYLNFSEIALKTDINRSEARRYARALLRKGLAKYSHGLFHEDGTVAGSGYCITIKGCIVVKIKEGKNEETTYVGNDSPVTDRLRR